jgi:hypothetical protein
MSSTMTDIQTPGISADHPYAPEALARLLRAAPQSTIGASAGLGRPRSDASQRIGPCQMLAVQDNYRVGGPWCVSALQGEFVDSPAVNESEAAEPSSRYILIHTWLTLYVFGAAAASVQQLREELAEALLG